MTDKQNSSKTLHVLLWVAQVVLGLLFLMAGFIKATRPAEDLAAAMNWPGEVPILLVRFIGVSEFLGGIGLFLPSLLRIKPILTPLAAIGLSFIMLCAVIFHSSRGELTVIGINILFGFIAGFIAWGRLKKAPIVR